MSLLAHGPGGVEHLRIEGDEVLGFLLFFYGFPNRVISLLNLETFFSKNSFRISRSTDLSFVAFSVLCSSAVRYVSSLPD
jgi:hypothetical protein